MIVIRYPSCRCCSQFPSFPWLLRDVSSKRGKRGTRYDGGALNINLSLCLSLPTDWQNDRLLSPIPAAVAVFRPRAIHLRQDRKELLLAVDPTFLSFLFPLSQGVRDLSSYFRWPPEYVWLTDRNLVNPFWNGLCKESTQSGASDCGKGFVKCFLRVPLACMGSTVPQPVEPNMSFIGWTTGNSGAGVPDQKMASLVEAIHFKLSGMMSTW